MNSVLCMQKGDRVFTQQCSGAYAQFTTADQSSVFPLSDRLTFAQGAALSVPYRTAYVALKRLEHVTLTVV